MIEEIVKDIVRDVEDRNLKGLAAYARLKSVEKIIKEGLESVYEQALKEADEQGEKTFKLHGFYFEKRNGRATYSFKHIPDYVEAESFLKEMKAKYTNSFKLAEKGQSLIDEDTGEQVPVARVQYSKDSIIVK